MCLNLAGALTSYSGEPLAEYLSTVCQPSMRTPFATHYCIAHQLGHEQKEFEFQRLHGMGDAALNQFDQDSDICVRKFTSPVGSHKELLPLTGGVVC